MDTLRLETTGAKSGNPLERDCQTLYEILKSYREILNRQQDGTTTQLIVSNDHNRYLVIHEGWQGKKRVHALLFDAEIRNDKIWLHHDGLDHGITDELVAAGVPKDHIVLAFHPPQVREHTGYAVA
jgi:hypothetical protein